MHVHYITFWAHNLSYICVSGEVGALLNWFKPSSKIILLTVPSWCFFLDQLCYFCLVLLCFLARLFVDAL